jgi:large subunit ribosomal protein L44e
MKIPKQMTTYCPKCRTHQTHQVTLLKKGRERALAEGARRHERKKQGYGGQKYPRQRTFAKTTKKQTIKLTCKTCGHTRQKKGIRLRKLEIQ